MNSRDWRKVTSPEFARWFWARVKKLPSGCWVWTGKQRRKKNANYGLACVNGRWVGVHRIALMLHNGEPLEAGQCALHHCDNPPCVRVGKKHLFEGTQADNMKDMREKGRAADPKEQSKRMRGSKNPAARLTWKDVRQIRKEYAPRYGACAALGRKYGVTRFAIHKIVTGEKWKESA